MTGVPEAEGGDVTEEHFQKEGMWEVVSCSLVVPLFEKRPLTKKQEEKEKYNTQRINLKKGLPCSCIESSKTHVNKRNNGKVH